MAGRRKKPEELRSHRWLGVADMRSFGHRSRLRQIGYDSDDWQGKPVIGIVNTWSDFAQCHAHFKHRVDDVKRGILMAGGLPVDGTNNWSSGFLPAVYQGTPFRATGAPVAQASEIMDTESAVTTMASAVARNPR